MVKYLVPNDTANILRGEAALRCEHMGLLLTRYAPQEVVDRSPTPDNRYELWRDRWLKSICARFPKDTPILNEMTDHLFARWIGQTGSASRFRMSTLSRLIVGLGGKGTLEFGITLHHTTGLPYIPGSALKGLCRNYALLLIAEKQGVSPESSSLDKLDEFLTNINVAEPDAVLYRQVFGSLQQAGFVIFHDALFVGAPSGVPMFTLEVMTPHFTKYYRTNGKDAPDDGDQPNPVTFLTVSEGAVFAFAVGQRQGLPDDMLQKQARRWLREALQVMGIGAKTASGYGSFAPFKE